MGKLLTSSSAEHLWATSEPFEHLAPVMDVDSSDWCQGLRLYHLQASVRAFSGGCWNHLERHSLRRNQKEVCICIGVLLNFQENVG